NPAVSIYLNGRIDLLIDTEETKYIIDFKTGRGDKEQLDFYSLLIHNNEETDYEMIDKFIYDVMDKKFLPGRAGNEADFAWKIKNALQEFFTGEKYTAEYSSRCERCKMFDICRVVIK
ncbi:MAG: PD-(D/E)XK nuclease family protein, partial [Halanaerobiaceae bacterium]